MIVLCPRELVALNAPAGTKWWGVDKKHTWSNLFLEADKSPFMVEEDMIRVIPASEWWGFWLRLARVRRLS